VLKKSGERQTLMIFKRKKLWIVNDTEDDEVEGRVCRRKFLVRRYE